MTTSSYPETTTQAHAIRRFLTSTMIGVLIGSLCLLLAWPFEGTGPLVAEIRFFANPLGPAMPAWGGFVLWPCTLLVAECLVSLSRGWPGGVAVLAATTAPTATLALEVGLASVLQPGYGPAGGGHHVARAAAYLGLFAAAVAADIAAGGRRRRRRKPHWV